MNNWKIISKIAALSGIIFIIFAALAAFLNYIAITIQYSTFVPASFIQVSIVSSMLPYLLSAVILFVVSSISSRAAKETVENEQAQSNIDQSTTETTV